jgi:hypothetical protein
MRPSSDSWLLYKCEALFASGCAKVFWLNFGTPIPAACHLVAAIKSIWQRRCNWNCEKFEKKLAEKC